MLKCQHVEQRADALVDGTPLSRRERLALNLHLLICRHCRRYLRQLRALVGSLRAPTTPLPDASADALAERIQRDASR
ncbi:MAG: zf-HC2 domain-containing protein [Alloalcanivorax venustensis]|uniref:anti-sigma factor family protein n=1 Tax=Alloalcanivorax venustensis TaxID=172371 RepID=UPI003001442A